MARQIKATASNEVIAQTALNSIGFLNFWTLTEQHVHESDLIQSAYQAKIPTWMADRIKGRSARSAWTAATQLGAKGKPSRLLATEPKDAKARYLTRDLNEESRAIVRETIMPNDEKVTSKTLAIVYLEGNRMNWNITSECEYPDIRKELESMLTKMSAEMASTTGMVNSGRIRSLILDWLERQNRICVRGTGGVYMIPRPKDQLLADELIAELMSIQSWVKSSPITGIFSVVELFDSAHTSKADFVESAIQEVKDELAEVEDKLKRWSSNKNMNAGSTSYSAKEMVTRLDYLATKVEALKDSLGEMVGVADSMIAIVRKKAISMAQLADQQVQASRLEKSSQISSNGRGPEAAPKAEGKKKGTAKERAEQVSF